MGKLPPIHAHCLSSQKIMATTLFSRYLLTKPTTKTLTLASFFSRTFTSTATVASATVSLSLSLSSYFLPHSAPPSQPTCRREFLKSELCCCEGGGSFLDKADIVVAERSGARDDRARRMRF
ncbi:hypothetical protein CFOL_v3_07571 [Cephalotus follicularis]|uniref:Uncharacterized protein n=1 Tax=Cephalotus follicularis TaxID=3775 RepID=A0A1Q3B8G0_CEPFO|nr:hypothetical protein CFOL_v3_07571 [Cephalotus follicularis]